MRLTAAESCTGLTVYALTSGASADGKLSQSIIKADAAMYDAKNFRNSIRMYSN